MIRLKYKKINTTLPITSTRGNVSQRMQKARIANLEFYDELQHNIKNNEIAPNTFTRTLKRFVGKKTGIALINREDRNESAMSYLFDSDLRSKGYTLEFHFAAFLGEKIHKNAAPKFLRETQNLLNEIYNPKILKRFINLFNKGYNVQNIVDFYNINLKATSNLTPETLNKFLEGKSNLEKIDTLQYLRYKLLSEQNTKKALRGIDNKIQKYNNFRYEKPQDYYSLDAYFYDQKLELLNNELSKTIDAERNLN